MRSGARLTLGQSIASHRSIMNHSMFFPPGKGNFPLFGDLLLRQIK